MKRQKLAAIDVGTYKICTVMADTDGEDLRILGVGVAPSGGLQKGMVINLNDAMEAIRQSVKSAEQAVGYKLNSAIVSITGRHITSINNRGVIAITSDKQIVKPDDVQRVLNVAKNSNVGGPGATMLHMIPQKYAVDGQVGIKNPVGMHGFRLDVDTHIVNAASASVENLTKCVKGAGIEIEQMVFSPLAGAEAVLTADEKQTGVIMADIGGGTTGIAAYQDGNIFHTSVLPVAGHAITHDISVGLGVAAELAEEIKLKYGSVGPGEDNFAERTLTEGGCIVPYAELYEIIRTRVEELLRLILLELPADYSKYIRSGVVLTGGTANLSGIAELGLEITHLPVRIGIPPQLYGVSDSLMDPSCAAVTGLLLWNQSHPETMNLVESGQPHNSLFSELAGLFGRKQTPR
ncbi:MAG: cell division protein FtsA [Dehalococcoidia bacterium]|nr:cell division protein FtsA [Dehalococcoidia bacterium]